MKIIRNSLILGLALAAMPLAGAARDRTPVAKNGYVVYVGTYTGGKSPSKGIYAFRFQPSTGAVTEPELVAEMRSPTWLTLHPNRRFLYAVSEQNDGTVDAFAIDPATGKLKLLNSVSSGGKTPCYVSIDHTGKSMLVANYTTGNVLVRRINEDGSLGEQTGIDQHVGPKIMAHSIMLSADNKFALGTDKGTDQVFIYRFDAVKGTITPNNPPFAKIKDGSGARHLAFHPNGKFVYVISEQASTVTALAWDGQRGALSEIQSISSLPGDYTGKRVSAEVKVSADGKFLYASNREINTIAVFSIGRKGTLTPVQQVPTLGVLPRDFALDPTGAYLFAANLSSNNVVMFHVDRKTGRLNPTGKVLSVGSPVCVTSFLPLN